MLRRDIPLPRSDLRPGRRERGARLSNGEVVAHSRFFVPTFGARRQLVPDAAAHEFYAKLTEFCRPKPYKPYPIRKMGITILGQNRITDMFLRADVQPGAPDMLDLAVNVRDAVGSAVKSNPHVLKVPLGQVAIFGNDNKIAATLEGWKGFDRRYAPRDEERKPLANHQIVREMNAAVGEVVQFIEGGIDGSGEYVEVDTQIIQRQTPHFTFAEKPKGQISNGERVDIAGRIQEFMPEELDFFDPIISLDLVTPGTKKIGMTNNRSEISVLHDGMYVRRPKFDDFGGAALQSCFTQGLIA